MEVLLKGGIKTYDIIVEFNGIKVGPCRASEYKQLRKGDVVNIKVFRQTSLFRGDYHFRCDLHRTFASCIMNLSTTFGGKDANVCSRDKGFNGAG